jgi:hypothetical protein
MTGEGTLSVSLFYSKHQSTHAFIGAVIYGILVYHLAHHQFQLKIEKMFLDDVYHGILSL